MMLPVLEEISIERLSLYKGKIEQSLQPGINMVIGGNGVGKTTLVQTVLFALLGNAEYETQNPAGKTEMKSVVALDFFKGRITPEDENHAKATLKFRIGRTRIEISRALFRPRILKLTIGGRTVPAADEAKAESEYRKKLAELMNFQTFEHFVFVAANLLLFDEARRTLIWDPQTQNRVVRLLFLTEFHSRLSDLSEKATTLDTTARHKSETRKDINKSIARWLQAEEKANSVSDSVSEARKVGIEVAQLEESVDQLNTEITQTESKILGEAEHVQELLIQSDQIEGEKLTLGKELQRAEAAFYNGIYDSLPAQYLLVLQTLANQGLCQVCGANHSKLKELAKKLTADGKCLVCRSPMKYSEERPEDADSDKLSAEINKLRERLSELEMKQLACIQARAVANHEISTLQPKLSLLVKQKRSHETRLTTLKIELQKLSGVDTGEGTWLRKQKQEIEKLTSEISSLYSRKLAMLERLKTVNAAFTQRLASVNEHLTPLFSQFASKFLGVRCELVVSEKTRGGKPLTYMYPRFNEKDRPSVFEVSESQRFFIDQAFRMALITLFATLHKDTTTFFIVETPEGSLDLAYERNVAEMYLDFAKHGHSIIVTSNLNSSNFLRGLYSRLGGKQTKRDRTLDLLHYGRLSSVQGDDAAEFNNRLGQLGLKLSV